MKKILLFILLLTSALNAQVTFQRGSQKWVWAYTKQSNYADYDTSAIKFDYTTSGKWWIRMFGPNGTERFQVDTLGGVHLSPSVTSFGYAGTTYTGKLTVENSNMPTDLNAVFSYFSNNNTQADQPVLALARGRGTSTSKAAVQDDDKLGEIIFVGYNGTDYSLGARIFAEVSGTPGDGDMPGALIFQTSADGSENPTERARIDHLGVFNLGLSGGLSGSMRFTASDNDQATIGINTSDQLAFAGASGGYSFASGNVGIGTTSPGASLEVSGNIELTEGNREIYQTGTGISGEGIRFDTGFIDINSRGSARINIDTNNNDDITYFSVSENNINGSGDELFRVLSGGNVGIRTTAPTTMLHQAKWSADALGSYHTFSKSRNATQGSHTVVQDNDAIGGFNFAPSDGTDFGTIAAQIKSSVDDASPAASSIGGDLTFSTAKGAGADDLTLALTIDNNQDARFERRIYSDMVLADSIFHAYGGFEDSLVTIDLTQNTWVPITNAYKTLWTGSEVYGFTFSGDTVTVGFTGDIEGIVSITFNGSSQKEYQFDIYNVTQARQEGFKQGATGNGASNYVNVALPVYIETTAGDKLIIRVQNISGDEDIIFEHAQFSLKYVHN